MSLRRRLTRIVGLSVAGTMLCFGLVGSFVVRPVLEQQYTQQQRQRVAAIASQPAMATFFRAFLVDAERRSDALPEDVQLVDATGQLWRAPDSVAVPVTADDLAVARGDRPDTARIVRAGDDTVHVLTTGFPSGDDRLAVRLTTDITGLYRMERVMRLFLAAAAVLAAVTAVALSGVAIRASLRPLSRLTAAATDVAHTDDLSRRVAVDADDEIGELAHRFNAMLDALERSRLQQQRLVADAGHELRTPLTSLRGSVDLLLRAERRADRDLPPDDRRALLETLELQTDELTALVGDLTELARDGAPSEEFTAVDLAEVVGRALDRVRSRAPAVTFDVDLQPSALRGIPLLLERAAANLLDNAVKYSPPGGRVGVHVADGTLVVTDQGPGIATDDLDRVFERFFRSDDSRRLPGSGLGLAIVRHVADIHGGTASASNGADGGAALRLQVGDPSPASPASAERVGGPLLTDRAGGDG